MKKLINILMMVLLVGGIASGQTILLVEYFDYPEGTLLTTQGWLAHSSGGTNPVVVTSPCLLFTGYVGSGIGLAAGVNKVLEVNTCENVIDLSNLESGFFYMKIKGAGLSCFSKVIIK